MKGKSRTNKYHYSEGRACYKCGVLICNANKSGLCSICLRERRAKSIIEGSKYKTKIGYVMVRVNGVFVSEHAFIREYMALQQELEQVRQKLSELENRLSGEEVMVVRDITKQEAKEEIRQLLKKGDTLYFSDIADKLRLDLEMVVDICRELQGDKEIGIDEEALARTK